MRSKTESVHAKKWTILVTPTATAHASRSKGAIIIVNRIEDADNVVAGPGSACIACARSWLKCEEDFLFGVRSTCRARRERQRKGEP